jgi:hypothetical protein
MSNSYSSQIDEIVADSELLNEEKIARLQIIESQARDLQRAASSSTADNSGDTDDDVTKVTREALGNERK